EHRALGPLEQLAGAWMLVDEPALFATHELGDPRRIDHRVSLASADRPVWGPKTFEMRHAGRLTARDLSERASSSGASRRGRRDRHPPRGPRSPALLPGMEVRRARRGGPEGEARPLGDHP